MTCERCGATVEIDCPNCGNVQAPSIHPTFDDILVLSSPPIHLVSCSICKATVLWRDREQHASWHVQKD